MMKFIGIIPARYASTRFREAISGYERKAHDTTCI